MSDQDAPTCEPRPRAELTSAWTRREVLLLALVLAAAFHGIDFWVWHALGLRHLICDRFGRSACENSWYGVSLIMPLLLCLAAPARSGLRLGTWRSRTLKVLGVCAVPPVLAAIVYPFTSRPLTGHPIGMWLISPAARICCLPGICMAFLTGCFPDRSVGASP